jgi:hypothetical protein
MIGLLAVSWNFLGKSVAGVGASIECLGREGDLERDRLSREGGAKSLWAASYEVMSSSLGLLSLMSLLIFER